MPDTNVQPEIEHGSEELRAVTVDAYNAEMRTADGFLGDRASMRAFRALLQRWRDALKDTGKDPLGDEPSNTFSKRRLDRIMVSGQPVAAGLVLGVVEEFAGDLAFVLRHLLQVEGWQGTERIVVGGGLRGSRIGELAIGRCNVLLRQAGIAIDIQPIRHDPDEAGLIGGVQLAPEAVLKQGAILAADIGGSNVRAGIVEPRLGRAADLSRARVTASELWRHADDLPEREAVVERLAAMLRDLLRSARRRGIRVAPFLAVGCPGRVMQHGHIAQGAQNLPGDWEDPEFNLPQRLAALVPEVGGHRVTVRQHNDAVVQGLSQTPFMQDVRHWGVLTIGTGLGNARFTNRS